MPEADVIVLDHNRLDRLQGLADLAKVVPVNRPVTVSVTRIARADIPAGSAAMTEWLDQLWLELDADLENRLDAD